MEVKIFPEQNTLEYGLWNALNKAVINSRFQSQLFREDLQRPAEERYPVPDNAPSFYQQVQIVTHSEALV